jgi:Flp pilus assembly pilin Flp
MNHRIRFQGEQGQTMAEYAVALSAITLFVISALALVSERVSAMIINVAGLIK